MSLKTSILYVDDEPINLMVFEVLLKEKYHILKAESGYEGLALLNEHSKVNIVVTDMKMPGMNGLEFARLIKQNSPEKGVFLVTSFEANDEIKSSIEEKLIDAYFIKPLNMTEFEKKIKEFLEMD